MSEVDRTTTERAAESDGSRRVERRHLDGWTVTIVRSRTAVSTCVIQQPPVLVLDLDAIAVSPFRVSQWTLLMAGASRVVLVTAPDQDLPVDRLAVDVHLDKPLTDEKLGETLAEFERRDRYAALLDEYEDCVARLADPTLENEQRRPELRDRARELRGRLAEFEASVDDTTFGRTMREILQQSG